jgi:hypothetical protein
MSTFEGDGYRVSEDAIPTFLWGDRGGIGNISVTVRTGDLKTLHQGVQSLLLVFMIFISTPNQFLIQKESI